MAFKVAELFAEIKVRDQKFKKGLKESKSRLGGMKVALAGVAAAAGLMAIKVGAAAGRMLVSMITTAAGFEEAASKFKAVFKDQAAAATKFADKLSAETGRSVEEIRGSLAQFQDTFVPLGFAREEARKLSQQVTQLAIDLASFNDKLDAETVMDLQSALVGNTETVRKYGIIITQASLSQELLNMGITGGVTKATELQKVMARLAIIMKSTKDAQGDASKTSRELTNLWKSMSGKITELGGQIGALFVPAVKNLVAFVLELIPMISAWIKQNEKLLKSLITIVGKILEFVGVIVTLFVKFRPVFFVLGKISSLFGKTGDEAQKAKEDIKDFADSAKRDIAGITGEIVALEGSVFEARRSLGELKLERELRRLTPAQAREELKKIERARAKKVAPISREEGLRSITTLGGLARLLTDEIGPKREARDRSRDRDRQKEIRFTGITDLVRQFQKQIFRETRGQSIEKKQLGELSNQTKSLKNIEATFTPGFGVT